MLFAYAAYPNNTPKLTLTQPIRLARAYGTAVCFKSWNRDNNYCKVATHCIVVTSRTTFLHQYTFIQKQTIYISLSFASFPGQPSLALVSDLFIVHLNILCVLKVQKLKPGNVWE